MHWNQGRYPEAVELCGRALDLYARTGDLSGQASTLANRGYSLQQLGRDDEALSDHRRALDLTRRIGQRTLESTVLVNLGMLDRRRDDHTAALTRSLAIYRELSLPEAAAIADRLTAGASGDQPRH